MRDHRPNLTDEVIPMTSPKFTAGLDLLGRTGMKEFQIRYCGGGDDAEQPPVAWIAVAIYGPHRFECAAAPDGETALMRLCEVVIDGGTCTHCRRPTGFDSDSDDTLNVLLTGDTFCWYMFDPELATFRRGCEGDTMTDPTKEKP